MEYEAEIVDNENENIDSETEIMKEPEPSYAYLLDKDKERLCRKDLNYCTRNKDGKPIPFCFEYPKDKKCFYNTNPPNLSFMGCYDDITCDNKPVGKIKISTKDPPYAYTIDGKCVRSSKLCDWITDDIAVPQCTKENNVQTCRDAADNFLIGCYTEDTCGGNVFPKVFNNNSDKKSVVNQSLTKKEETQTEEKKKNKIKISTPVLILIIVVPILLTFVSIFSFYIYRKKKRIKEGQFSLSRRIQSQQFRRSAKSQKSVPSKGL